MFKKINDYLLERPKLLLGLLWGFLALAVIPGVIMAVWFPGLSYGKFLAIIIVPTVCALYLRLLYSRIREEKNRQAHIERAERQAAKNAKRNPHKKRK